MIKILNSSFSRLGVVKNAITSSRLEEINGENTVDFTAVLDSKLSALIDKDTIYEVDDNYFDTAVFKKSNNEDNTYTLDVESEHISYRLNRSDYNVEYFTEIGTPAYILSKILEGTDFTVEDVEFYTSMTYSIQEAKSRRGLLMEFAALLGGELLFNKFKISILQHRGSTVAKPAIKDRNVKVISTEVNKRTLDDEGNPKVSYSCTPIYLPGDSYSLGDEIVLIQRQLGIKEALRVVSIDMDIYDPTNVTFKFSNYVNGLESSVYRIATSTVVKDALYNGCRIGPEYGFEAVRNDKNARAYFRSDEMKFQSGDGSGTTWKDRLYYTYDSETDETTLVLDGQLSATMIEALSAVITPNLYAEKATISELTVDELDTSDKIRNYLASNKADVNYLRIYDQTIKFITASLYATYSPEFVSSGEWETTGTPPTYTYYSGLNIDQTDGHLVFLGPTPTPVNAQEAFSMGYVYLPKDASSYYQLITPLGTGFIRYSIYNIIASEETSEQAVNRNGELLWWTDDTHKAATTDETSYPVMQYVYTELVKASFFFEKDGTDYVPKIVMGAGDGVTANSGKAYITKPATGLELSYYSLSSGTLRQIRLANDGIFIDGLKYELSALNIASDSFQASYGSVVHDVDLVKDGTGRITALVQGTTTIPITYNEV